MGVGHRPAFVRVYGRPRGPPMPLVRLGALREQGRSELLCKGLAGLPPLAHRWLFEGFVAA